MVTPQAVVKIMDFGLARLTGQTQLTRAGTALGTAAYMSPEQAQGKPVDRRTDLWSLGAVLYEMVSGQSPFRGDTDAAVVHSILHEDPEPVTALRAGLPLELDRVIAKALAKEPAERYQHAEDLLVDLRALRGKVQQESKAARRAAAVAKTRRALAAGAAGLLLGAAAVYLWHVRQARLAPPPEVVRFAFDLPDGQFIQPTWNSLLTFSPDGSTLAYANQAPKLGGPAVVLRRLDSFDGKRLDHTARMSIPIFSPDGQTLLLQDPMTQVMKKVAITGGAPAPAISADFVFRGEWVGDSYYWTDGYFGPIVRTPIATGKSEPVTRLDLEKQERTHRHARMLPGGKTLMFTVAYGGIDSFDDARIEAFTLAGNRRKLLVQGGFSARYSPSGHLVYAREGNLYAVPFDPARLDVTGGPFKVVEGVFMSTNTGSAHFDISSKGALAYAVGKAEGGERTLEWVDRAGKATPLQLPPRSYLFPRISPDGRQIAYEIEGVNHDLYTFDPERGVTSKMTTDGVSHAPVWTPDAKRLAFRSWKAGTMTMWWMPADRSAAEERLTSVGSRQSLVSFSPDGKHAAFNQMAVDGTGIDVFVLPLTGDRSPQPFIRTKFMEATPRFSPDGNWVAYCSAESGRPEVYVQSWPGPGPKIQISSEGGVDPIWSRDGKELFYRNGDKMMSVPVATRPAFKASRPQVLWEGRYSHGMSSSCGPAGVAGANYDVSADGKRFLMVKDAFQDIRTNRIVVVVNFAEELKRLQAQASSKRVDQ
jgi:serine/threonine-protein kinase